MWSETMNKTTMNPPIENCQHSRLISGYTGSMWLAAGEPDDDITEIAWCLDCGAQIAAPVAQQPEPISDIDF